MTLMGHEISNAARRGRNVLIDVARQGAVCVLRCKGPLLAGVDSEYLRVKADEFKSLNCGKVLGDFREVPRIGSTGLSFIVGIYTSVTNRPGGRFVLVGLHPRVREVLELTRLSTVIPLASDMDSGLAMLNL